ncbi:MAG: hypothetical protein EOM19_06690 [Candidatus Moranbacteria bacterium]|nr:hypothetical protein [Candidatus Moranbacteria bacterium]
MKYISHTFNQKQSTWIIVSFIFVSFWIAVWGEWFSFHTSSSGNWEIAFVKPQDDSDMDFFIFNASKKNIFSYTITQDGFVIKEGGVEIDFNEKKVISFEEQVLFENRNKGIYQIEIKDALGNVKDIYRQIIL